MRYTNSHHRHQRSLEKNTPCVKCRGLGKRLSKSLGAYINVEKRRLEFAEPMVWHTPTVVKLEPIPLYTHQRKSLSDDLYNELMFEVLADKYPNETRLSDSIALHHLQAEKGDEKAAHGIKENT
jgi:hypothetical protein